MSTARRAYDLLRGYVAHEWERIQGVDETYAEAELNEAIQSGESAAPAAAAASSLDNRERARQTLGVSHNAGFDEIRAAFEKLNKRSDPGNFPPNTREARDAAEIQKRVHWAYSVLTEGMDATEKRFKSLEI
ncbi:MAG TPA: hypothetical protein VGE01_00905 [Fimbriimonas sp.]